MQQHSLLHFILKFLRPFRWWVVGQLGVSLIWAVDLSLRPYVLKIMLDRMPGLSPAYAYEALLGPALLYIFLAFFITFTFRVYDFIWLNINPPLKQHINFQLMEKMMQQSHSFYQHNFAGTLATKIKDIMSGVPDLLQLICDHFLAKTLAILIAIGTGWTVNYKFSWGLGMWIVIFIWGSLLFLRKGRKLSAASAEIRSVTVGTMVDIFSNIASVRLFAGRPQERKNLRALLEEYVRTDQTRDWFFLKLFAFQGGSFVLYQGICIFWLIQGFKEGNISAGDFVLILMMNISLVEQLWSLSKDMGKFAEIIGHIGQGLNLVLAPIEVENKPHARPLKITQGTIIFDHVDFHYKGARPLFQNLSLTIPAGQKVGLVGYSGSGKSTFVNLILRLFETTKGHILIDHQPIINFTQDSLRSQIAMIPQEPSLFHRSLMENIRYGRPGASDQEVIEAAQKAYAHEFIEKIPEAYEALVGERGVKLSGGQRQRIAIARAVLKDAPILILDEATSQLDSVTETKIQEALWQLMEGRKTANGKRLPKTTLVVAHRLSTLLDMDRILVFNQGQIVEDGTHQELIDKGGLYKSLWDAQVGGFLPEIPVASSL